MWFSGYSYPTALSMVASGTVNVKPLVTHHFKLEQSLEAFEVARTGAGGAIKVMIACSKWQTAVNSDATSEKLGDFVETFLLHVMSQLTYDYLINHFCMQQFWQVTSSSYREEEIIDYCKTL